MLPLEHALNNMLRNQTSFQQEGKDLVAKNILDDISGNLTSSGVFPLPLSIRGFLGQLHPFFGHWLSC